MQTFLGAVESKFHGVVEMIQSKLSMLDETVFTEFI